jgi:hypothetical protein
MQDVTKDWRKLCNEELHDLYSSPNMTWAFKKRKKRARHVARMGERGRACRVLVGKQEETI